MKFALQETQNYAGPLKSRIVTRLERNGVDLGVRGH